jgi:hypothetical protein
VLSGTLHSIAVLPDYINSQDDFLHLADHICTNHYLLCRHTTQAEVELQLGKTRLQLERTRGTVAELRRALSSTQQAQASAIATAALNDARAESASIAAALSNGGLQSRDEHVGWGTTATTAASPARAQRSHNGHTVDVGSPRYSPPVARSDAAAAAVVAAASPHSGSVKHSRQRKAAAGASSGLKSVTQKIDAVLLSDGDAAVRSRARRPLARTSSNTADAAGTATAATAAGATSSASQRQSTGLLSRGGAARVKTRHHSSREQ